MRVRRSTPRTKLPPGLYTDPLVPFVNPITGKPIEALKRSRVRWGEPTVTTGHTMYPLPFEVAKGQNQPIWVDIHVPKYASAGTYKGKFTVTAREDITDEILVTLIVWDFTLPDGPTHRNHFGGFRGIPRYFEDVESDSEKFKEIEMRYCEEMAAHRINPPIPESLLPEVNDDGSLTILPGRHRALKDFLSRLHVTDFEIPRSRFAGLPRSTKGSNYKYIAPDERKKAQRYYREYYDYLKENGWEKRAYLYMWDEPNLSENYEQVLVLGEMIHDAVPELRILVVEAPVLQKPDWPDMDSAVDIWCPLWPQLEKIKNDINEKVSQGDEVWSYTALTQGSREFRSPYWHIDRPLIVYRVPTWMNWHYNINGLLYWSTMTGGIKDPWFNPAFIREQHFNGGGFLLYPGTPCGIEGAVSCMRLKNLRDGMEDYEYFAILEKLAGKEAVNKIVDSVTPKYWIYPEESEDYLTAREKLAEEILKAKR